jgi:hypothetical protein
MLADVGRSGRMLKSAFPPVMHTHFWGVAIAFWEIRALKHESLILTQDTHLMASRNGIDMV